MFLTFAKLSISAFVYVSFGELLSSSSESSSGTLHQFGHHHALISLDSAHRDHRHKARQASSKGFIQRTKLKTLKVFHISDTHISLQDDFPPDTTRMFSAFAHTQDRATREPSTPAHEFVALLKKACAERVDLIALGGDILNFPSNSTVAWVLEQLRGPGCGIPFVYTAGNHDWHKEGDMNQYSSSHGSRYDSQRVPELATTLRPLFEHGAAKVEGGGLYGRARVKGVDILFVDNSNHQITDEQLTFAKKYLGHADDETPPQPALLLLHMPLALPGVSLEPKDSCGDPRWGPRTDVNWQVEGRPHWPESGNSPSTQAFIDLVQASAAPSGRLVALLTGHVHKNFGNEVDPTVNSLASNFTMPICTAHGGQSCDVRHAIPNTLLQTDQVGTTLLETDGCVQYVTLDGAEGGYRLVTLVAPASQVSDY